jgi:hypothetical protein
LLADIIISHDGFRISFSAPLIMPQLMTSAKQISRAMESRRGRSCDIYAQFVWHPGHVHQWCIDAKLSTRGRNSSCTNFGLWLCKGDLSITFIFSPAAVTMRRLPLHLAPRRDAADAVHHASS